ncbi:uncharacterized protein [Haliotis asinina]|uniref:uncharacterized protein n=1 Tax=Haliotis asinina TaxID=109174 RepID=UPI003531982E
MEDRQVVHFRHFGPGPTVVSDRQCCLIVDICTNYAVIDRLHTTECTSLFHLHWEGHKSGNETSSIRVSEADADQKSVITPDRINNLLKDQTALHDFIRKMLTAHQVQLIHMEHAPLLLTFQHCRGSDRKTLLSRKPKVILLVKEFLKHFTRSEHLETLNIEILHRERTVFGNAPYQYCSEENAGMQSAPPHQDIPQGIPDTLEKRFKSIEEELSHQKKLMESEFMGQEKQYEDIRLSLCSISATLSYADNKQSLWSKQVQPNILDLSEPDLESLDSIYQTKTDIYTGNEEATNALHSANVADWKDKEYPMLGENKEMPAQNVHGKSEQEHNGVDDENCLTAVDMKATSFENKGEGRPGHSSPDMKQNSAPPQKDRLPTERRQYNDGSFVSKVPSTTIGLRRQCTDEVTGGNVYPNGNYRQCVNTYDNIQPTYQTAYEPVVNTRKQLKTHYTQSQRGQTPASSRLRELLFGNSTKSSEYDPFPDIQTEDLNFDMIKNIQRIVMAQESNYGDPRKENINGDEQREKHFRLMLECIIGDSPYWSRLWASVEEALLEDESPVPRYDLALDTVICMDTSSSMWGDPFYEMKKIVLDFINGIEDIAERHDIEENIALVTFGGRANVVHHLTNDYGSLRDAVENITPGGPSPIMEGVLVSLACLAKGGVFKISTRMQLRPRLIFITDGLPTGEIPETSTDGIYTEEKDKDRISRAFAEIRSRQPDDYQPDEITFVPVGPSCNMSCLQALASFCDGKVADATSVARLPKYQFLHKYATHIIDYIRDNDQTSATFRSGLQKVFLDLEPVFDQSDTRDVYNLLAPKVDSMISHGSVYNFQNVYEDPELPPLGSRVVRGPDWLWGNQDTEAPGTIFNHALDNIVWVIWDNGHSNVYRYGHKDKYDVITVEDQPRDIDDYFIAVGVQVERGPDWHLLYGNQDGGPGSYGTVIRIMTGRVKVRWQNGGIYTYRHGFGGMFDLSIRDPVASIIETTAKSEVCSGGASVGPEQGQRLQESENRLYVWQRRDNQKGWESYTEVNDAKLKKEYGKNAKGSCLIQRNGESFRVSFKSLQERSVTDKTWVPVRQYLCVCNPISDVPHTIVDHTKASSRIVCFATDTTDTGIPLTSDAMADTRYTKKHSGGFPYTVHKATQTDGSIRDGCEVQFREIRGNFITQIGSNNNVVDITITKDFLKMAKEDGEHLVTDQNVPVILLKWHGAARHEADTANALISTWTMRLKEMFKDMRGEILQHISHSLFSPLRLFIENIFNKYDARLTAVCSGSLLFMFQHADEESAQRMVADKEAVQEMFHQLLLEMGKGDIEFTLEAAVSESMEVEATGNVGGGEDVDADALGVEIDPLLKALQSNIPPDTNAGTAKSVTDMTVVECRLQSMENNFRMMQREVNEHMDSIRVDMGRGLKEMRQVTQSFLETLLTKTPANQQDKEPTHSKHTLKADSYDVSSLITKGDYQHAQTLAEQFQQTSYPTYMVKEVAPDTSRSTESTVPPTPITDKNEPASYDMPGKGTDEQQIAGPATIDAAVSSEAAGFEEDVVILPSRSEKDIPCQTKEGEVSAKQTYEEAERLLSSLNVAHVGDSSSDPEVRRLTEAVAAALVNDVPPPPRAMGMDTVLCLDVSDSIGLEGLEEVKKIANNFVDGIEDIAAQHGVEENVGVVSLGGGAKVVQRLTNDYGAVRDAIESLVCYGKSPIFEALLVCVAEIQEGGGVLTVRGVHKIRPRIIFITDGLATDDTRPTGQDTPSTDPSTKIELIQLMSELSLKKSSRTPHPITWVPVAAADRSFLSPLSKLSDGNIVEGKDIGTLCTYYRKQESIAKIYMCVKSHEFSSEAMDVLADVFIGDMSSQEKSYVIQEVKAKLETKDSSRVDDDPAGFDIIKEVKDLPPLGSRVIRGPDWKYQNQDLNGPGTIINHADDDKYVWVQWDLTDVPCPYRFGYEGMYDITEVDDHPRILSQNDLIEIGCRVRRGDDWSRGDEEGGFGNTGVVIRKRQDGKVKVRWDNGTFQSCNYGYEGKLELVICSVEDLLPSSQRKGAPTKDVASKKGHAVPTAEKPHVLWQWHDDRGQWRLYDRGNTEKLNREFARKPTGSCVIQKQGKSFRVLFSLMQEKSAEDSTRHNVRRRVLSDEDRDECIAKELSVCGDSSWTAL